MRKAAAVLLLTLSLLTVISPHRDPQKMKRLCGDNFYEECKRLTEESIASQKLQELSDQLQDSADSDEEVRTVSLRLAKRHDSDNFMPIPLSLVKRTCCELGCNQRFMRYTCR